MRRLVRIVVLLVILLAIGVAAGALSIDRLARAGIERGATYALGVETSLESADVKVLRGEFALAGLRVANPKGFEQPHFLILGEGGVAVSLASLRRDLVELPSLALRDVDMNLERREGRANYDVILENLKRFESGEKPEEEAGGKRFVIREVRVRDVMVRVDMLPVGGQLTRVEVPIDEITLKDVGSDTKGGVLLADLSSVLIKAILAAAVRKGGDLIPADVLGGLRDGLGGLESLSDLGIDVVADLGKGVESITGGIGGQVERAAGGAVKGVEGVGDEIRRAGDEAERTLRGLGGLLGGGKDEKKD